MSAAAQYYIITLLVYAGVSIIACWGLDLEYGQTGVLNFGFVVFQAAGAYTAAVLTLGPSGSNHYEQYLGGANSRPTRCPSSLQGLSVPYCQSL